MSSSDAIDAHLQAERTTLVGSITPRRSDLRSVVLGVVAERAFLVLTCPTMIEPSLPASSRSSGALLDRAPHDVDADLLIAFEFSPSRPLRREKRGRRRGHDASSTALSWQHRVFDARFFSLLVRWLRRP